MQFAARHALKLRDNVKLTNMLESHYLVHLCTDQERHSLENTG